MPRLARLLILPFLLGATAPFAAETIARVNVGYRVQDLDHTIDVQKTQILAALWYPTDAQPRELAYSKENSVNGHVAPDAPIKPGKWPLVLFSHGFSGGGIGSVEITEALAAGGYIVAAPDHSDATMSVRIRGASLGNLFSALKHLTEVPFTDENYRYRPLEVSSVLNGLLADNSLGIDAGKVAVMGHSMGGWSVVKAAKIDPRVNAALLL